MAIELNEKTFLEKVSGAVKKNILIGALAFSTAACQVTPVENDVQNPDTNIKVEQQIEKEQATPNTVDPYLTSDFDYDTFDADNFEPPSLDGKDFKYIIDNEIEGVYKDKNGSNIILLFSEEPSDKLILEIEATGGDPDIIETLDVMVNAGEVKTTSFINIDKLIDTMKNTPIKDGDLDELSQGKRSVHENLTQLEDDSIFNDYKVVNIDNEQLSKYTEGMDEEYSNLFSLLVINHELAHTHLALDSEKPEGIMDSLYDVFDFNAEESKTSKSVETLKGEIYADSFGLLKVAEYLKAEHGEEDGLEKFSKFSSDFKSFREFAGDNDKIGDIKRTNIEFLFDDHFTLPTNIAVADAITDNWGEIGNHSHETLQKVALTASEFGDTNFVNFYKDNIQNQEVLDGKDNYLKKLLEHGIETESAQTHAQKSIGISVENCDNEIKDYKQGSDFDTLKQGLIADSEPAKMKDSCSELNDISKNISSKLKI